MHLSEISNIAQALPAVPNTPAAYYGLGAIAGAIICVVVWFVREAWLRRSGRSKGGPDSLAATVQPAEAGEAADDTAADAAAKAKKSRKLSYRDLMYIGGIYIGIDLIARGAKGIFPSFPADALVWGALTGFVLCLMVLMGVRNLSRRKISTGQET